MVYVSNVNNAEKLKNGGFRYAYFFDE